MFHTKPCAVSCCSALLPAMPPLLLSQHPDGMAAAAFVTRRLNSSMLPGYEIRVVNRLGAELPIKQAGHTASDRSAAAASLAAASSAAAQCPCHQLPLWGCDAAASAAEIVHQASHRAG